MHPFKEWLRKPGMCLQKDGLWLSVKDLRQKGSAHKRLREQNKIIKV